MCKALIRSCIVILIGTLLSGCDKTNKPSAKLNSDFRLAAGMGQMERVINLLDQGADVNSRATFTGSVPAGGTAIMLAAGNNHLEVVSLLIERGANVNMADDGGATVLIYTVWKGHEEIVALLLRNGADIHASTKDGRTPLSIAEQAGHTRILKMLKIAAMDVPDGYALAESKEGVTHTSTSVRFALVLKPLLNARTVVCDVIIGNDESGPVMHEIVSGSLIRRTMSNLPGLVMIIDLDGGQMLVLDTAGETGSYVSIEGQVKDRTQNYVEFVRQLIRQVLDGEVEELGEQIIDGKKAIGFVGKGQNEAVTIWADPETAHPIRVEAQIGKEFPFVMKNLQFDVPVEDSLVSMDLPAGYTEEKATADLTDVNEKDLVESLRIFAEVLEDGVFPETIGTETTMKRLREMVEKAQQTGVSEEEIGQLGTQMGRGMIFHQMLETQGQWNYAGAGVKLGDAATAIFWYQPQGSDTYRVIYGDLSVKDVAESDLPK